VGQRVVALVVSDGTEFDERIRGVAEERIGPWAKPKGDPLRGRNSSHDNGKIQRNALGNSTRAKHRGPR